MKTFLLVFLATLGFARAEVEVNVTIEPLPAEFAALDPLIRAHVIAATKEWVGHFQTVDCTLEVTFSLRPWAARGAGRSLANARLEGEMVDGKQVTEEGAPHKIRTGKDANGARPDIEVFFDPTYFRSLWFDPHPEKRFTPLPLASQQKLDAYSVILHELGHAFGFNGFLDQKTGANTGRVLSTYDRWVTYDGKNFYFNGPAAKKANYGNPVLLAHTNNNYHHVAEKGVPSTPKLTDDLMNGITLNWSRRYSVSPLDVAILTDCGLTPVK